VVINSKQNPKSEIQNPRLNDSVGQAKWERQMVNLESQISRKIFGKKVKQIDQHD